MPKYINTGDSWKLIYEEVLWYSMVSEEDKSDKIKYPPFVLTKGNALYDEDGRLYYESFFGWFCSLGKFGL
jgi:hypothetical protein